MPLQTRKETTPPTHPWHLAGTTAGCRAPTQEEKLRTKLSHRQMRQMDRYSFQPRTLEGSPVSPSSRAMRISLQTYKAMCHSDKPHFNYVFDQQKMQQFSQGPTPGRWADFFKPVKHRISSLGSAVMAEALLSTSAPFSRAQHHLPQTTTVWKPFCFPAAVSFPQLNICKY